MKGRFLLTIWHIRNDGSIAYGYQCYNQLNNGSKKKREALGLDTEGFCDIRMVADWKLDFMAKAALEHLWKDRKASVLLAIDLIKRYYKDERTTDSLTDTASIQAKLDKATVRLQNLIAMRADGEITKEEYQAMRSPIDEQICSLQKSLEGAPATEAAPKGLQLDKIVSALNSMIDFSNGTISHDIINQFVYRVTPTSDSTFDWYLNLSGTSNVRAPFTAKGRKKDCVIKLEEIEKISSLHTHPFSSSQLHIINPRVFTLLHRPRSKLGRHKLYFEFSIGFEEAKRYRNANGQILRHSRWQDLTCQVYI